MSNTHDKTSERIWPWSNEPWHLAQRERWDALIHEGWRFGPPAHPQRDHVGIEMVLADDLGWPSESHSFWVSKANKSPEDVHSEVLKLCERAALNPAGKEQG